MVRTMCWSKGSRAKRFCAGDSGRSAPGEKTVCVCELLGGVMTGGYTIEPSHFRSHKTIVNSMTAIIIDPGYLGGSAAELKDEATRLCDYVKASPARDPKAQYAASRPCL